MKSRLKIYVAKLFVRIEDLTTKYKYSLFRQKYDISKSFMFNGNGIRMYGEGQIIIGDDSYIGENSYLQSVKGQKIQIGKYCAISHNVKIYTSSYVSDQNFCEVERITHEGNVIIGDGVWIGVNVLINPGITIGNNVIIGANSVVTKNIPDNSIYAGVPAKLIRVKNNV